MSLSAIAATVSGAAVASVLLALATWSDGSPQPWIWVSLAGGPLGLLAGGVALARGGGRTAMIALAGSGLVCAFWLFVLFSLARGAVADAVFVLSVGGTFARTGAGRRDVELLN